MRVSFALACLLLLGKVTPVYAQPTSAVNTLDQSLFDSEPLEDVPPQEEVPAIVTTPKPAPKAVEAPAVPETIIQYDTARLQGLNKVTAETLIFEAPVDTLVTFGTLTIIAKKCVKSKPEERPENAALLLINDQKPDTKKSTVFSGWMFSSSPSISALEHPVYDITMLECTVHKKP